MNILKNIKSDLVLIKSESPEINAIRDNLTVQISESEKTSVKDLQNNQSFVQTSGL